MQVNGRFLYTSTTGVQRFAKLISFGLTGVAIVTPTPRWSGRLRGNIWEQLWLPGKIKKGGLLWSPANIGPLLCRRQLLVIHDAAPLAEPRWFSRLFALWYILAWKWLLFSGVSICTVSRFSRRELASHLDISERKIGIIPNGGDHICELLPEKPRQLKLPDAERFILVVGSVQPRKNLAVLARACALPGGLGAPLVVAGGGDKVFAQEANLMPDADGVHLLGRVSDAELAWLYRSASLLIAPSLYEGFDIPPLEALNLGCPILLSDIPVHREIFGDTAGYFASTDEHGLVKASHGILSSVVSRVLPKVASDLVERFTWENAASQAQILLSAWSAHQEGIVI